MKKSWFEMRADATASEIAIFDEIGSWGVSDADFAREFDALVKAGDGPITLYINSPGGSVFDGVSIYNTVSRYRERVTVEVTGVAASAASIVALAGKELRMGSGTFLMIHNPWSVVVGSAEDMREEADVLDKIGKEIAAIYAERADISVNEVLAMMNQELWMNGEEAVAMGFATEPEPPKTKREIESALQRGVRLSRRRAVEIASKIGANLQGEPAEETGDQQGEPAVVDQSVLRAKAIARAAQVAAMEALNKGEQL